MPEPPKSEWSGYEITQPALEQKALGFNCLNYAKAAEPSLGRHFLPSKDFLDANCVDGVRFEIMFPSRGNGQTDSADHKSHVAYPSQVMSGDCPSGFSTRYPSMFFETIFQTNDFKGQDGEFVLATGDTTGYSNHGDFMEGWESGVLSSAIKTCTNLSGEVQDCPIFDLVSDSDMQQCQIAQMPSIIAHETCDAKISKLYGDNPITSGPQPFYGSDESTSDKSSDSEGVSIGLNLALGGGKVSAAAATPASKLVVNVPSSLAPAAASASAKCAKTQMVIKGEEAWEVCIEEELVYVTAGDAQPAATPAAAAKRHLHNHAHKHAL